MVGGEEEHYLLVFSVSPSVLFSTFLIDSFHLASPFTHLFYIIQDVYLRSKHLVEKYMGSAKKNLKKVTFTECSNDHLMLLFKQIIHSIVIFSNFYMFATTI